MEKRTIGQLMYLEIGFLNSSLQFSTRSVFIVINIED